MRIHASIAALHDRPRPGRQRPGLRRCEQLRAQIGGLRADSQDTQAALSFVQAAEEGLHGVHAALQRMRALTLAAGEPGAGDDLTCRALQAGIAQEAERIDRVAADTRYGTVPLLDGSFAAPTPAVFEVGAQPRQRLEVAIDAADAASLGVDALDVRDGDPAGIVGALGALDRAITATSTSRVVLGAAHHRLRATVRGLEHTRVRLMAAERRVRDAHLALRSIQRTANVVVLPEGTPVLVAAQPVPESVLDLLGLPP